MREHDAVRVDVLRPALAVVGVLGGGTGTHPYGHRIYSREHVTSRDTRNTRAGASKLRRKIPTVCRSVVVQRSRGLRGGGGGEGWP